MPGDDDGDDAAGPGDGSGGVDERPAGTGHGLAGQEGSRLEIGDGEAGGRGGGRPAGGTEREELEPLQLEDPLDDGAEGGALALLGDLGDGL